MIYRGVLFDFGGVIVDSPLGVFVDYERRHGVDEGTISKAVIARGDEGAWARLERGELDLDGFAEAFEHELREDGAEVDVADLMASVGRMQPRPEMLAAIRRARTHAKTGLITNNWRQEGMTGSIGELAGLFDAVIESCVEGVRKPDPRIYEIACDRLGVAPEEVVFLDDLGMNLKPARAMGMHTIKVTDPAEAIAELDAALGAAQGA